MIQELEPVLKQAAQILENKLVGQLQTVADAHKVEIQRVLGSILEFVKKLEKKEEPVNVNS